MPEQRVVRVIATVAAVAVVLSTGVAWSKIRSFEDGIFHVSAAALGQGGDDGAIDNSGDIETLGDDGDAEDWQQERAEIRERVESLTETLESLLDD